MDKGPIANTYKTAASKGELYCDTLPKHKKFKKEDKDSRAQICLCKTAAEHGDHHYSRRLINRDYVVLSRRSRTSGSWNERNLECFAVSPMDTGVEVHPVGDRDMKC